MQRITSNSFANKSRVEGPIAVGIPAGAGSFAVVFEALSLSEHLGLVNVKTKEQTFAVREAWVVGDDKIGSRVDLEPIEVDDRGNRLNDKSVHVFGGKPAKRKKATKIEPEKTPKKEAPKKKAAQKPKKAAQKPKKTAQKPKKAAQKPKKQPVTQPSQTLSKTAESILGAMRKVAKGTKFSKVRITTTIDISTAEWTAAITELLGANMVKKTGKKRGTKYELV